MEEKKTNFNENFELKKLLFNQYDLNIVILTVFFSKNSQKLILSSHNLTLYSLHISPSFDSLQNIYSIPTIYGNSIVLLEMEKNNIILTGHETGSIIIFHWKNDKYLIKIKQFNSKYYEGFIRFSGKGVHNKF